MKNIFTKNTIFAKFDNFSKVVKSVGIALFSLIASAGFAQSGTILVNGSSVPVSSATKFPIWLSTGQTVNISTNVSNISGILYNIIPSSAGGNILTMNSVVNITGFTTVAANTTLKLEGILFSSTTGTTSWNIGGNTPGAYSTLGTNDNSALSIQSGTGTLSIGTDAGAKTINMGTASDVINENGNSITETVAGNYNLNGTGASSYNIGAATTSGTISIGGTGQTGAITIGAGPGTPVNIGGTSSTTAIGHNATVAGTLGVAGTATFSNSSGYSALFTGGYVGIGNSTPAYNLDVTGTGRFNTSVISPSHIFTNSTNGNTVTLQSGVTTTSYILTLPTAQGANGQTLVNNGSGTLNWANTLTGSGNANYVTKWNSGATGVVNSLIYDNGTSVGIGTATPNASATLDLTSTTLGFLPPRMNTAQRNAINSGSPPAGLMIFNTDNNCLQFYNGTSWVSTCGVNATGGAITAIGGYQIHTFTSSGTFTVTTPGYVQVLVVAGGGGGGGGTYLSGGGGAGGLVYNGVFPVSTGTIAVTVGAGGAGGIGTADGSTGSSSSFGTITAAGGGGGGNYSTGPGLSGGSGGGGNTQYPSGGTASPSGQGNAGGTGYATPNYGGGGGGGAGGVGGNGTSTAGGNGGVGLAYSISGSSVYYAGGGGGSVYFSGTGGAGGLGGGGAGSTGNGTSGTPNTGGGGGGAERNGTTGGSGGSGIVIVTYPH